MLKILGSLSLIIIFWFCYNEKNIFGNCNSSGQIWEPQPPTPALAARREPPYRCSLRLQHHSPQLHGPISDTAVPLGHPRRRLPVPTAKKGRHMSRFSKRPEIRSRLDSRAFRDSAVSTATVFVTAAIFPSKRRPLHHLPVPRSPLLRSPFLGGMPHAGRCVCCREPVAFRPRRRQKKRNCRDRVGDVRLT